MEGLGESVHLSYSFPGFLLGGLQQWCKQKIFTPTIFFITFSKWKTFTLD